MNRRLQVSSLVILMTTACVGLEQDPEDIMVVGDGDSGMGSSMGDREETEEYDGTTAFEEPDLLDDYGALGGASKADDPDHGQGGGQGGRSTPVSDGEPKLQILYQDPDHAVPTVRNGMRIQADPPAAPKGESVDRLLAEEESGRRTTHGRAP